MGSLTAFSVGTGHRFRCRLQLDEYPDESGDLEGVRFALRRAVRYQPQSRVVPPNQDQGPRLGTVTDGLDIMAVGIQHEGGVVMLVVMRSETGAAVVPAPGC